jgi:hypothetical protein
MPHVLQSVLADGRGRFAIVVGRIAKLGQEG